jgi:hypothetical protein
MPDLESHIAPWRNRLAAALGDGGKTLDELEGHLRDEIHALMQKGTPLDTAVNLAMAKLGAPEALAQEFGKNTQWWWPIYIWGAVLLLVVIAVLVLIGVRLPGADGDRFLLLIHIAGVTIGYVLSFGVGGLAVLYGLQRMVRDLSGGQRAFWMKTVRWTAGAALAFTIVGVALGAVWAGNQLGQAWDWDPREIGAVLVIAWLAVLLATTRHLRWLLCAGMAGNLVVTFAWFVAPVIPREGQLHSYGGWQLHSLGFLVALGSLVISHVLLMAGTLAPVGWLRWRKAS